MNLHPLKLALAFAGIALVSAALGIIAQPHPVTWAAGGLAAAAIAASVFHLVRRREDRADPD
jgi:hypothetical protein